MPVLIAAHPGETPGHGRTPATVDAAEDDGEADRAQGHQAREEPVAGAQFLPEVDQSGIHRAPFLFRFKNSRNPSRHQAGGLTGSIYVKNVEATLLIPFSLGSNGPLRLGEWKE
jgi:hypothetical protein